MNDDPMRVRGSFYLAKDGFGGKEGFGGKQASKSPRSKKISPNRLGLPKKKK